MNSLLPELALAVHPGASVHADFRRLLALRTRKTPEEMESIRSSFLRSSRAIAKTLRFGKAECQKRRLSEWELAEQLKENYGDQGAVALSFKTISGAGANSAIVHYSNPSKDQCFDPGKLALLDSGAYYPEGFATDCTRGFFAGGANNAVQPEPWQKEIYTATLRAAIQVFIRPVDAGWSGKQVDAFIRSKVKESGHDYLHGTGHGIGIHVHEEGIRLSTLSIYPQSPFACVSVEPGIYLEGRGGVRVENVALLHPEGQGHYRYENVVFVGYDWDLIDVSMLDESEKSYLRAYEARCRELGTQLTECPL
jgi:Xaa-Pro aminopeptidase